MRKLRLLLIAIIIAFKIFSQGIVYETPVIRHFTHSIYNSHPQSWYITQDTTGLIYVATNGGITVYNGSEWQATELRSAWTLVRHDDNMYVSGDNYIAKVIADSLGRVDISEIKFPTDSNYDSFQRVYSFKDRLYFMSVTSVAKVDSDTITYIIPRKANMFIPDSNIFLCQDLKTYKVYDISNENDSIELKTISQIHEKIDNFMFYNDTIIAISERNIYLIPFDIKTRTSQKPVLFQGLLSDDLRNKGFSNESKIVNNVLVATLNTGGFLLYNLKTKEYRYIIKYNGDYIGRVNSFFVDKNGNIWAATDNGVYLININSPFRYIRGSKSLNNIVSGFFKFRNELYYTSLDGLYKLVNQGVSNTYRIEKINKRYNSFINAQIFGDSIVYIATRFGASTFDGTKIKDIAEANISFTVFVPEHNRDLLFLGLFRGLEIFKREKGEYKVVRWYREISNPVREIVPYGNRIFFANDTMLLNIKETGDIYENIENTDTIFFSHFISKIWLFNGKLIVRSGNELFYIDKKGEKHLYNRLQAFIDERNVVNLFEIDSTTLLFLTLDKPYFNFMKLTEDSFIINNNFSNAIDDNHLFSGFYDKETQKFWAGGTNYLLVIDTKQIHNEDKINYSFKTNISKIEINDSTIYYGIGKKPVGLKLEPKSDIKVKFSASYFQNPNIEYSYKLIGYNDKWSKWSKDDFVNFTNLRYGKYTLLVKSKNIFGKEGDVCSFTFEVKRAFYQTVWARASGTLLLILIIYLIVYLNSKRLKAQNKKLEKIVDERTKELKKQNILIKNSIEYARKIQTAVLPSSENISLFFNETFILHMPKDLVSGDFYWFHSIENKAVLVSADCTGHGVPGGFMSMIGNTLLNEIIKEQNIFSPAEILNKINNKINHIFDNNDASQSDGMDISVVFIDKDKNIIEFASANQTIFIFKQKELIKYDGDLWSIGSEFGIAEKTFSSIKFNLNEINAFYLATDGYFDQFGEQLDKKLMKSKFINLIKTNFNLPMSEQYVIFKKYIVEWKGNNKQTDDIQVIGIRL